MPYRRYPIVRGEIYHVFNRSIARQPIFLNKRDYKRAVETIYFYSFKKPRLRFSHYNNLSLEARLNFINNLKKKEGKQIKLLAFCFMPNHFHFLIKETNEKGIASFMTNFQHSYAKYFNIKNHRSGSLFQSMFKAVRIETDEQLLHVSRYIHLNPLTSYVLKEIQELEDYAWSSYKDYTGKGESDLVDCELLFQLFSSSEKFKKFTLDQVDYQRELEKIKHLILE